MSINPVIAGIKPVSRGIITDFTDNDRIGQFLTASELGTDYQDNAEVANVPAMYQQGSWKVEKDLELSEEGTAFAYYPYSDKVVDGTAVPLEIQSQTDYLYATPSVVDEKNPIAQVGMRNMRYP
ncbi:fimbrillin family protein [Bacteroides thetaiotaomicron]|uniref:fimbrillin family protein n=1 Tax=Bacteroides thetaiotaomicron TaxID=818 RepID=UPI001F218F8D|nr:fimbrillin family protein [Bacteroides thetaiotaomicron]